MKAMDLVLILIFLAGMLYLVNALNLEQIYKNILYIFSFFFLGLFGLKALIS